MSASSCSSSVELCDLNSFYISSAIEESLIIKQPNNYDCFHIKPHLFINIYDMCTDSNKVAHLLLYI